MQAATIPTISRPVDLPRLLKTWQAKLSNALPKNVATPEAPFNFKAVSARGGIELSWSPVTGADGYQILRSASGDFSQIDFSITLLGNNAASYFNAIATSQSVPTVTKYYKVRATAGTPSFPQTVLGVLSGIVSQTCLATNDTSSSPTTTYDTTTTDGTQTQAGRPPVGPPSRGGKALL